MFSPFTIFEQLVLAMKKRVALKFLTLLNILFTFRIFNNLNLPWKQSFPWKFSLCWKCIFYYSGVLSNFVLPLKNRVALEFFNVLNIPFTFRSFEQLALALWNRGCPEFIVLNIYFLSFRIFEQLALALKTEFAPKFFKSGGAAAPPTPRLVRLCAYVELFKIKRNDSPLPRSQITYFNTE